VADPITDLYTLLTTNYLCLISALAFVAFFLVLLVILRIRQIRSQQNWAYNPGKTLKYKWRRG
jgi:hypothetical protein